MTEPVRKLFSDTQPGPSEDEVTRNFVDIARTIASICSTRVLLLIAVMTGAVIWSYTIWDPGRDRLYAAIAFSLVFVLPQVALYYRKG